ncbi:hypothetical protein DAEQUDRAFT_716316 [Daedalea quercina L-15889]|uniref:Condensation domain-containing protein n=1 Tax=Daedalea quercina L-15889 TaxID=1314783 RepID=A0A165ME06_9APHY|nr:hypothetical protein DAEQUDRAFT_716316 [Daedalea quercina L-15889]
MRETVLTTSRPLSISEYTYALVRQGGGMSDPATIVSLACSEGHIITDDEVVSACAALRLRYPLLGASVALFGTPHFVVNSPMTHAHALRTAKDQIEFHTFDDQEKALITLRDQWLACDTDRALDIRERTCALWWGKDADSKSGKYILGLITTHFATDNRRRLNLVRRFLELLASPGQAKAELNAHFSGRASPVPIPSPTENLRPELSGDEEEARNARLAFDDLVTRYMNKPMFGIIPDGLPSAAPSPRMLRQVWSSEDTTGILRACKAHGVTITHLVNVAGALASVCGNGSASLAASGHDDDAFYFDISQQMDITAKLQKYPDGAASGDMEAAVRVETYPIMLRVSRSAVADANIRAHVLWEAAKQFREQSDGFVKSPYFWHFLSMYGPLLAEAYRARLAGRGALPFMSSLGDLKMFLPTRYAVQTASAAPECPTGAEIRVTDKWTTVRIDPCSLAYHLFTFQGRLHLQLMYNASHTSEALVTPWFNRLLDILSRAVRD